MDGGWCLSFGCGCGCVPLECSEENENENRQTERLTLKTLYGKPISALNSALTTGAGGTTKKKPPSIKTNTFMHDPYQRPIPSAQSSHTCSAKNKKSEIKTLCSNKFQV